MTYEKIMESMLARVPEKVKGEAIDKREGSIIYSALAPAAQELAVLYTCLDDILDESFADTADRENLVRRAAERGLSPYPATHALWRGEFNIDVPIGALFSIDDIDYAVVQKIEDYAFALECETEGAAGNELSGDLIPVEYIDGLESATLTELLIPGEDEEDTEVFRERYFDSFRNQAFGGNASDYRAKVFEIPGVGAVNVIPVWNGPGTVKLVIADAQYHAPSQLLIDNVQEIMDPTQEGDGLGLAPIGHVVTVEGVGMTDVNVTATFEYEMGYNWLAVQESVYAAIDAYLGELSRSFGVAQQITVRVAELIVRLSALSGIVDLTDVQLNGSSTNYTLPSNRMPQRGQVNGS